MKRKRFDAQLRSTVEAEDKVLLERFKKADSVLLQSKDAVSEARRPSQSSVMRDTFSMPPRDNALIALIREKAAQAGTIATRSEIVRAGLHLLSVAGEEELRDVLGSLEKVQPGRKS